MNVSYLVLSFLLYGATLYLGRFLRYLNSTFLIPSSADFALALSLFSLLLLNKINSIIILIGAFVTALLLWKSSGRQVLYLKIAAYTFTLLIMPFLSYDAYEYARSMLTGFLFVNQAMLTLSALTLTMTLFLMIFEKFLLYSIFDPEYASFRGLKPALWLALLTLASILMGFTMTLSYGFLLAHVIALAASSSKEAKVSILSFLTIAFVLSFTTAIPLACAISAVAAKGVEVLLLRLRGQGKVWPLWQTSLRGSRTDVSGVQKGAM